MEQVEGADACDLQQEVTDCEPTAVIQVNYPGIPPGGPVIRGSPEAIYTHTFGPESAFNRRYLYTA